MHTPQHFRVQSKYLESDKINTYSKNPQFEQETTNPILKPPLTIHTRFNTHFYELEP